MHSVRLDEDVQKVIEKMRFQLYAAGRSTAGIFRAFEFAQERESMETAEGIRGDDFMQTDRTLDRDDFSEALNHAGVFLSTQEVGSLFRITDADKSGRIDCDEMAGLLMGPLPEGREKIVRTAFSKVAGGRPDVSREELLRAYDAEQHPRVRSGELGVDVVVGFLDDAVQADPVTEEDFVRAYQLISTAVPSDRVFEDIMTRCWHIST